MPISAMPEHLNTKEKIDAAFPDDSQYDTTKWYGRLYRCYQKSTKTWFCFSYRCTEWWAKCRKYPKVLFAIGDDKPWRMEGAVETIRLNPKNANHEGDMYLSRVQYYKRWHFAIQLTVWEKIPLVFPMFSFNWYLRAADVPRYGEPLPNTDDKVLVAYWGHVDNDLLHWLLTSAYAGRNWK